MSEGRCAGTARRPLQVQDQVKRNPRAKWQAKARLGGTCRGYFEENRDSEMNLVCLLSSGSGVRIPDGSPKQKDILTDVLLFWVPPPRGGSTLRYLIGSAEVDSACAKVLPAAKRLRRATRRGRQKAAPPLVLTGETVRAK